MAGCGDSTCSCNIQAGAGIIVQGSGTLSNPFIITSDQPDFSKAIRVQDAPSLNLNLDGAGTTADPFILSGAATVSMIGLSDVKDPEGGPQAGEVPVWVVSGVDGHWEFKSPPPAPAGAVNANGGLGGDGTAGNPLRAVTSGTLGDTGISGNGTTGLRIYTDVDGKLRTERPAALTTVAWGDVTGKPGSFPPTSHEHVAADITNQSAINAGKVNNTRIYSTTNGSTPPTSPAPFAGDLWFFNAG